MGGLSQSLSAMGSPSRRLLTRMTLFQWATTILPLVAIPVWNVGMPIAQAFQPLSPPQLNRCPSDSARNALLDPSWIGGDSFVPTVQRIEHQQQQQRHVLVTIPLAEHLWTSATATVDLWTTRATSLCQDLVQQQQQHVNTADGENWWDAFWTSSGLTVFSSSSSSEPVTTDVFLVEHGPWQAYQCTSKAFDSYSLAPPVYYFHTRTGASQWDKPYPDFPTPTSSSLSSVLFSSWATSMKPSSTKTSTTLWATPPEKYVEESSSTKSAPSSPLWDVIVSVSDLFSNSNSKNENVGSWKNSSNKKPDDDDDENLQQPWWAKTLTSMLFKGDDERRTDAKQPASPASSTSWWPFQNSPQQQLVRENDKQDSTWWQFLWTENKPETPSAKSMSWWPFVAWGDNRIASDIDSDQRKSSTSVDGKHLSFLASSVEPSAASSSAPWEILFRNSEIEQPQFLSGGGSSDTKVNNNNLPSESERGQTSTNDKKDWIEILSLYLTKDASRTRSLFTLKNIPVVGFIFADNKEKQPRSLSALPSASKSSSSSKAADTSNEMSSSSPATTTASSSLMGMSPESREQALQEKRYAASVARQANLRKNYDDVVYERSPTISLTALKKNNKKTWLKYLDD